MALLAIAKRIEREDKPRRVSLEVMLRGTCAPARCRAQIVAEHPDLEEEDVRQALGYAAAIARA